MAHYVLTIPNYAGLRPAFLASLAWPWQRYELSVNTVRVQLALRGVADDPSRLLVESDAALPDVQLALAFVMRTASDEPFVAELRETYDIPRFPPRPAVAPGNEIVPLV